MLSFSFPVDWHSGCLVSLTNDTVNIIFQNFMLSFLNEIEVCVFLFSCFVPPDSWNDLGNLPSDILIFDWRYSNIVLFLIYNQLVELYYKISRSGSKIWQLLKTDAITSLLKAECWVSPNYRQWRRILFRRSFNFIRIFHMN